MEINDEKSIKRFDEIAVRNPGISAVLDPYNSNKSRHSNYIHDYFSKKYLLENISFDTTHNVIDFGCGVGRLTSLVASKVNKIYGFDGSMQMIQLAQKINPNSKITYINSVGDIEVSSIDVVFTHWVLAHINDSTIQEVFKSLKPKLTHQSRICVFEQTPANERETVKDEVYKRRSINEYESIFNQIGFKLIKHKNVYRSPSYARSIWNKLPEIFKFSLPLLYKVEKMTLARKVETAEYFTTYMEFMLND